MFDTLGQGQIFASTGSVTATLANDGSVIDLSAPTNVQMNSIKLTEEAVPVTMTTTGYILDKVIGATVCLLIIRSFMAIRVLC